MRPRSQGHDSSVSQGLPAPSLPVFQTNPKCRYQEWGPPRFNPLQRFSRLGQIQ